MLMTLQAVATDLINPFKGLLHVDLSRCLC